MVSIGIIVLFVAQNEQPAHDDAASPSNLGLLQKQLATGEKKDNDKDLQVGFSFFGEKKDAVPSAHVSEVILAHGTATKTGTVYIVRHGEKDCTLCCLNTVGQARAAKYPEVFDSNNTSNGFDSPKVVFAFRYHDGRGIVQNCQRTLQTVTPTANKLGLSVINTFTGDSNKKAAAAILDELKKTGGPVLAGWESQNVKYLTRDLGVPPSQVQEWPTDDFDSVYELTYDLDSAVPKLMSLQYKTAGLGHSRGAGDHKRAFFIPFGPLSDGFPVRRR
jgi:hypothetical protein